MSTTTTSNSNNLYTYEDARLISNQGARDDIEFCDTVKKEMDWQQNIEAVFKTVNYIYITYKRRKLGGFSQTDLQIMEEKFGYKLSEVTFASRKCCYERIDTINYEKKSD